MYDNHTPTNGQSSSASKFDIRDHLDKLEPGKGKNFYTCPVCQGRRLGIDPKSTKFQCWSGGCSTDDIREAIRPLADFLAERNGEQPARQARKSKAKKKEYPPAPIPIGAKLLRLPAPGKSPRPERPKYFPKDVPPNALQITYDYSETQKVLRYEWPDATNPKGHDKTYRQVHIDPNGKEVWTKGDARWSAYKIAEVVELLKSVPDSQPVAILTVEGEENVELARGNSIAALTMQGSNWSHPEIQMTMEALQATGKNIVLAKIRDNDDAGIKKGQEVWLVARHIQFPCIVIDPRNIYPDIPEKGDIREILEAIGPDEFLSRMNAEIASQAQNPEPLPAKVLTHPKFETRELSELKTEVCQLLEENLKRSDLTIAIGTLSEKYGRPTQEIRSLYRELEQELEQESDLADTRIGIEQLLASKSASVKLSEIFPASLADPIEEVARRMNLKPECYALALISGISRFLKNGSSTMLVEEWNRYRCRTFGYFGALIAESSQMKTPVLNAMITDPLAAMRQRNQEKFNAQEKAYKEELELWKNNKDENKGPAPDAPVETIPYITKATWEGIAGMVGRNPIQGILWLCDELAGFFKSANQYRSGKGSDKEDLLECWSGNGAVVARAAGTTVNVGAVSLSIYGNIQPKVLEPFLGDGSDDNGTFARFDFVQQPPALTQITLGVSKIDINPMLQALYDNVDAIPMMQFELDEEARKLFVDYYNHCQRLRLNHPKQGMRAMLGKAAEKVGRVATILHCIHAAHMGIEVSSKIPACQVAAAIKWVEYTTVQALSINIEVCSPDTLESNLAKIISLAERKGGTVTARDVSKSFDAKYRPSSQKIWEWFTELATMNYGEVTTKGQSILFSLTKTSPSSPVSWNVDTVTVTSGDTYLPTVSPPSPVSNVPPPFTQSSGEEWGGSGDTNLPTFKSLPDKELTSSGEDGEVFTPSPKISQSSMMSCTTETAKPTATSTKKPKTFEVGQRVVVKDVGGIYQGARGEIVDILYGRSGASYLVKFDKPVKYIQQSQFEGSDLMKL